jgi:hypothetical protein
MPPEVRKLPPPIQDNLVQLLADGLHVGIGKASVQRAHAVGVVARAADDLLSWLLVVGRASSSLKKCGSPMKPLSRTKVDGAQAPRFP